MDSVERWVEDYDNYSNVYQSALDFLLTDTSSTNGFICMLKGHDLSFLTTEQDVYLLNYQNTPIEKVLRTKTPLIVKNKLILPRIGETNSFFGIPIQNKERVIGIVGLCGGEYTLQSVKKYKSMFLILRLEIEKLDTNTSGGAKTKDLFMANMSHEIRTPLNGVIGYTQLLLRTNATDVQKQYIAGINKCSLNLAQIVNDILDFSKLSCGKMIVNVVPTKVEDVINFVAMTLNPKIQDKKHTLTIYVDSGIPEYILIDKQKLIQILMNLVLNAIKFTATSGRIDINVNTIGSNTLKFVVKDNGVGISRENQNKLFRSFSQLDNTLTKSYDGTGLGLAICKKMLELMKGTIAFKSNVGAGSEFYFTVKYEETDESKCAVSSNYRGKSVVVIALENERRMELSDMFLKIGFKPTPCSTLREALQLMKSYAYDFEMVVSAEDNVEDTIHSDFPLIPIISADEHCIFKLVETVEKVLKESRYVKKRDTLRIKKDIKILIAEDNPDNQDVLVNMLKTFEYTNVLVVNDGVEAIQELQTKTYDVLLLDLKMPRINGYQVMDFIKNSGRLQKMKVIPLTASVMEEDRIKCLSYGTKFFLTKPIDMKELQQCLMTS